jgi:centromere-localized protein 2
LEEETVQILEDMKVTVGDLSDLRYGRFQKTPGADTDLRDEVLEALSNVEESADGVRDKRR